MGTLTKGGEEALGGPFGLGIPIGSFVGASQFRDWGV